MKKTMWPATLVVVFVFAIATNVAIADPPRPVLEGGLRTLVPPVPQQDGRPAEGARPEDQWKIDRSGSDNEPMASFIDSIKGSDAAVELIVGQGRFLTTKRPISKDEGTAMIAIGDPTVADFEVLANPRMIRLTGKRAGVTDLSITTDDNEIFNFEIHVGYDIQLLRARLQQIFPDALIRLGQIREHLVVEGQARSPAQVTQILDTIRAFLGSVQTPQKTSGAQGTSPTYGPARAPSYSDYPDEEGGVPGRVVGGEDGRPNTQATFAESQIINLLRVPGIQQVLLQVRIAELNRTALREIGANMFTLSDSTIAGTTISGSSGLGGSSSGGGGGGGGEDGLFGALLNAATGSTAFGIFSGGDFAIFLKALRDNGVLSLLAEPNLIAMNGHEASFLAGGEFPVPVPQGGSGINGGITIEYKDFGVQLVFVPYLLDDGRIRLHVEPEVSTIDFSIGTTLVVGGDRIPGLNTRKASTTVELEAGQTLAMAGLLEVALDAHTERIPGLGDLPYLGPLFSNTSHKRVEKELLVLVTPHLVDALNADQVGCLPGEDVRDPTDKEFYLFNRIEGRTCEEFKATTSWDRPYVRERLEMEACYGRGPMGFSQ